MTGSRTHMLPWCSCRDWNAVSIPILYLLTYAFSVEREPCVCVCVRLGFFVIVVKGDVVARYCSWLSCSQVHRIPPITLLTTIYVHPYIVQVQVQVKNFVVPPLLKERRCITIQHYSYFANRVIRVWYSLSDDIDFTSYVAFKQSLTGVILIKFCKVCFI